MATIDLRKDLRLSTLLDEQKKERSRMVSDGDLTPIGATKGTTTAEGNGTATERFGIGEEAGLPKTSQIVRTADSYPEKPCAICVFFKYDAGQNRMQKEGMLQVPNNQGGFLSEGHKPMTDDQTNGGPYDAREYGHCGAAKRPMLTHRFSTCEKWAGIGKLGRIWR